MGIPNLLVVQYEIYFIGYINVHEIFNKAKTFMPCSLSFQLQSFEGCLMALCVILVCIIYFRSKSIGA